MRERIARLICLATVVMVVAFSFAFARRHNPPVARGATPLPQSSTDIADENARRGQRVYDEHNCASCHSIGGVGNPRSPLDGAGARLTDAEIRARVTAVGEGGRGMSGAVIRRKERYREMPAAQMDALVAYLRQLRVAP